jgi:hypothetical protein
MTMITIKITIKIDLMYSFVYQMKGCRTVGLAPNPLSDLGPSPVLGNARLVFYISWVDARSLLRAD